MFDYLYANYIELRYGIGGVLTNIITWYGAMVLLTKHTPESVSIRSMLVWFLKSLLFFAAGNLLDSVLYPAVSSINTRIAMYIFMVLFLLIYSVLGSSHHWETCLVRSAVYFACYCVMMPVSEPLGRALDQVNSNLHYIFQYSTPFVVLVMTGAIVWFMRHYAFDRHAYVHTKFVVELLIISVLAVIIEFAYIFTGPLQGEATVAQEIYSVITAVCLWAVVLVAYYFFYAIARSTQENEQLLTMKHKNELELEKYDVTKLNYDELRMLRHEIKNHDFYMKELLEAKQYDKLKEYLDRHVESSAELTRSFDCGNYIVDVILNHEMAAARRKGIEIKPEVLIPKELPWSENEICSLLSNLLDNAIEAAAESGAEKPEILFRMQPRQEYLFIRVTNPFDESIPAKQRLSLKTTKKDTDLHGCGTRVIKRIAENNNGSVRFSVENGLFVTDVMIELNLEAKQ